MTDLSNINQSPEEMTDEQLRDNILKIRADRRSYNRGTLKKARVAEKENNTDWDEIKSLLKD